MRGEGSLGRGERLCAPLPSYYTQSLDTTQNTAILVVRLFITRSLEVKRNRQVKFGTFKCQCGCKEDFTAEYITRAPQYKDKKHRLRKLAANKAAARAAKTKDLFKEYKARRAFFRRLGAKPPVLEKLTKSFSIPEFQKVITRLKSEGHGGDNG